MYPSPVVGTALGRYHVSQTCEDAVARVEEYQSRKITLATFAVAVNLHIIRAHVNSFSQYLSIKKDVLVCNLEYNNDNVYIIYWIYVYVRLQEVKINKTTALFAVCSLNIANQCSFFSFCIILSPLFYLGLYNSPLSSLAQRSSFGKSQARDDFLQLSEH